MVKILVVDDEPIIADGLYSLLCQANDDYDVYKAYSASEALGCLDKIRMDIVLSDILMPGMNGIEMLTQIKNRWPACHVLFLSGYSDFEYVQSAMQHGADTYILKSQGDEYVLDSVAQTVHLLREEQCNTFWQTHLQEELKKAQPLLCRELLWQVLQGELQEPSEISRRFLKLGIPMQPQYPFMLVGARIDQQLQEKADDSLVELSGQIDAVFTAYLSAKVNSVYVSWNQRYFCWIVQPLDQSHADYASLNVFLSGTLEKIQEYCVNQLGASISLIIDSEPHQWNDISASFQRMRSILSYQLGAKDEMILGNTDYFEFSSINTPKDVQGSSPDILLHNLSVAFDYHKHEEYTETLEALLRYLTESKSVTRQIAVYHQLCSLFLEQINNAGREHAFWNTFHSYESFSLPYEKWQTALPTAFRSIAEWLFAEADKSDTQRFHQMVYTIHQYIDENLNGDLSVNALAEIVYLNPVYLSRAYRQATGNKLSEYVLGRRIDKAKRLLMQPGQKVSEIAYQVGFESAAHFSRAFKKVAGKSPQEYRDYMASQQ